MSDDLKAKARRIWEEIFPNADIEALAEVTHPDVVDHDDPPGAPQGFEGARSTMLWLHGVFSDQEWDIHHVLAEGDMVAVHCTMRATHTGDLMGIAPTGRRVEMDYIHLLRFEDGRVKDRWAVRDDMALMRQLGAIGGAPSGATVS